MSDADLIQLQEGINRQEQVALSEYFNESPGVAISSLQQLVSLYEGVSRRPDVPDQIRRALAYDELVARARLSKVLNSAGRASDAQQQIQTALRMSRRVMGKGIESEAALSSLTSTLDARIEGRWKRSK